MAEGPIKVDQKQGSEKETSATQAPTTNESKARNADRKDGLCFNLESNGLRVQQVDDMNFSGVRSLLPKIGFQ